MRPVIIDDLSRYNMSTFRSDLFAGLTVGVVALPLAMAFSLACGLGAAQGLYTAIVAGFLAALFGGCSTQVSGPTGAFVVIIATAVSQYGTAGFTVITLLAGIILILFGVCKMGGLIKYIPFPVVVGFTSGIAVVIFATQLKDILGLKLMPGEKIPSDFLPKLQFIFQHLSGVNYAALILTLFTVAVIVMVRNFFPKLPAMLIGMLATAAVSMIFRLDERYGVELIKSVGDIPRHLPMPHWPDFEWSVLPKLARPAFTIALLAAIESLLSATVADGMTGERHRSNMELAGLGIANIGSVLFGGIPATGAIARTATNIKSGGRTPVSAIIHALTLALIMLIFAPYAERIPLAALAGVLVVVCYNMSEWRTFLAMFKAPKSDWVIMVLTFLLTVLVDLVLAVEVGVVLAALLFIRRMSDVLKVKVISDELRDDTDFDDLSDDEQKVRSLSPEIQVFEIQGPFFFGAVEPFRNEVVRVLHSSVKVVILRMRHVPAVDATALNVIKSFAQECSHRHISLVVSGIHAQPLKIFNQSGVSAIIGEENIFPHISKALVRADELLSEAGEKSGK